jgi:hypothetical protein
MYIYILPLEDATIENVHKKEEKTVCFEEIIDIFPLVQFLF